MDAAGAGMRERAQGGMSMLAAARHAIDAVFLYAAFTEEGLVKVGISRIPHERIASIHATCPFPIRAAMWAWVGSVAVGRQIEGDLAILWKRRNTRGEWYQFDYAADKREFHDVLNAVFEHRCGERADWTRHSQEEIKRMVNNMAQKRKRPRLEFGNGR